MYFIVEFIITLAFFFFFNNQYSILIFMIKILFFESNSISCMDPFEIETMLFQNDVAEVFHYKITLI